MEIVRNKGVSAVTEVVVVTPAQPETFDLFGLTAEQMALIYILTGETNGGAAGLPELFNKVGESLGLTSRALPMSSQVITPTGPRVRPEIVTQVLSYRRQGETQ